MNNDDQSNLFLKNANLNGIKRSYFKKIINLHDIIHIYTSFQK